MVNRRETCVADAIMKFSTKEKLLLGIIVGGTSLLTRKALGKGWEKGTGKPVPAGLHTQRHDWRQVLAWGALSGAVVGIARLAAQEGVRHAIEDDELLEQAEDVIDL